MLCKSHIKKNNQVISDLKSGIFKKLSHEIKPENKKVDIDELLVSIDSKIKNNKNSSVINEK